MWDFMVTNPDNGTYVINIVDTTGAKIGFYTTETISADADASTVQDAINGFYSSVWDCDVNVTRTLFDADAVEIDDAANATQMLYTVTVLKQMAGFSTSGVSVRSTADEDKGTNATEASIKTTPPTRGQMSSAPFNGTFTVTCTDSFAREYTSVPINFDASRNEIERYLQTIPFLVDNIEVLLDDRFAYRENGISF